MLLMVILITLFMQLSCVENNTQVANAVFGFMQIWGVNGQYRWRTRPLLADYLKANLLMKTMLSRQCRSPESCMMISLAGMLSVLHCLSELSVGHQRFAFDRIISHSDAPNLTSCLSWTKFANIIYLVTIYALSRHVWYEGILACSGKPVYGSLSW